MDKEHKKDYPIRVLEDGTEVYEYKNGALARVSDGRMVFQGYKNITTSERGRELAKKRWSDIYEAGWAGLAKAHSNNGTAIETISNIIRTQAEIATNPKQGKAAVTAAQFLMRFLHYPMGDGRTKGDDEDPGNKDGLTVHVTKEALLELLTSVRKARESLMPALSRSPEPRTERKRSGSEGAAEVIDGDVL